MNQGHPKLIIAGSRSITSSQTVLRAIISSPWSVGPPTEVIHGGANGVDASAHEIADESEMRTTVFQPDWDEHGKAAGPIRNAEMAKYGEALVAVWDGESNGTRSMIDKALDQSLPVYVYVDD